MAIDNDPSPRGGIKDGSGGSSIRVADSLQASTTLTAHVSALRNDHSVLQQRVNQLSGGLVPPILPESQIPLLPVVPSGDTSLYARRIGFANYSQVDAAYQRDTVQFCGRVKAALYEGLVPHRWDDPESVRRMRLFFSTYGIAVDLIHKEEHQGENFDGVAQSDLVVRGDMVTRHLRSYGWVREEFVMYWTLLEICRLYGIYR